MITICLPDNLLDYYYHPVDELFLVLDFNWSREFRQFDYYYCCLFS